MATAEYACELNGGDAGPGEDPDTYDNDRLSAFDQVFVGGKLTLSALKSYDTPGLKRPTIVQSTDWASPDGVSGDFDDPPQADDHLGRGVFFRALHSASEGNGEVLQAEVFQASSGDVDGDQAFRFGDLVAMFAASGAEYGDPAITTIDWTGGDFTGDGAFTFADMLKAFSDTGASYGKDSYPVTELEGVGPAMTAVPEPGTVLMLLSAMAGLLLWRRRR